MQMNPPMTIKVNPPPAIENVLRFGAGFASSYFTKKAVDSFIVNVGKLPVINLVPVPQEASDLSRQAISYPLSLLSVYFLTKLQSEGKHWTLLGGIAGLALDYMNNQADKKIKAEQDKNDPKNASTIATEKEKQLRNEMTVYVSKAASDLIATTEKRVIADIFFVLQPYMTKEAIIGISPSFYSWYADISSWDQFSQNLENYLAAFPGNVPAVRDKSVAEQATFFINNFFIPEICTNTVNQVDCKTAVINAIPAIIRADMVNLMVKYLNGKKSRLTISTDSSEQLTILTDISMPKKISEIKEPL